MPNAGFMVGHCPIRKIVMGERAVGHAATAEELAKMQALLRESLAAGGLGFSSTWAKTHTMPTATLYHHGPRPQKNSLSCVVSSVNFQAQLVSVYPDGREVR